MGEVDSPLTQRLSVPVVAPFDGTNVEMWRRESNGDYVIDRTTFLNRYQTYHMRSTLIDYTGTYIRSDRPIAVYGGHECAQIPAHVGYCDHIVAAMPPVGSLGTAFGLVPFEGRAFAGYIVRILSVRDGTRVECNIHGTRFLARGAFWEIDLIGFSAMTITCSNPCLVVEFNKVGRVMLG